MAITKQQKKEILEKIEEKIYRALALTFVGYEKVKTRELEKLRNKLRESGGEFLVTKKTLLNLALGKFKFNLPQDFDLEKEVGLVFSYQDEILPTKIAVGFSKENENFKIKGGIFEKKFIDLSSVKNLAALPPKEILRAILAAAIKEPLNGLVNVLNGNLRSLVLVLNAISKK